MAFDDGEPLVIAAKRVHGLDLMPIERSGSRDIGLHFNCLADESALDALNINPHWGGGAYVSHVLHQHSDLQCYFDVCVGPEWTDSGECNSLDSDMAYDVERMEKWKGHDQVLVFSLSHWLKTDSEMELESESDSGEDGKEFVIKVHVKDNGAPDPDHGDRPNPAIFFYVDFFIVENYRGNPKRLSTEDTLKFLCEKLDVQSNGIFAFESDRARWTEPQ